MNTSPQFQTPVLTQVVKIAQFSDCHLFADKQRDHFGANVYQNLDKTLADISKQRDLDAIIFTGDLSQDHTQESYHLFAELVAKHNLVQPVHFLAGNHDDFDVMKQSLTGSAFAQADVIELDDWQLFLLNSTSDTPAGVVNECDLVALSSELNANKQQLVFMHHHPVDAEYYIDRHGLTNQTDFWQAIKRYPSIRAIACGHVHRGMRLVGPEQMPIFTCPATSIMFAQDPEQLIAERLTPGYQVLTLTLEKQLSDRQEQVQAVNIDVSCHYLSN